MTIEAFHKFNQTADLGLFQLMIVVMVASVAMYRAASAPPTLRINSYPHSRYLWLVGIALALRLPRMSMSFWYDETFTAAIVALNFNDMGRVILSDTHPPLMYIIQWIFVHTLGPSEVVTRLPSLLFGLLTVYAIYQLTVTVTRSQWVGARAGLIAAVMPALLFYSNEARAYSLMTLLVTTALIGYYKRRPALFAGALALLPLTHAYGYLYFAVLAVLAIYKYRQWLGVTLLASVPALVWFPFLIYQSFQVTDGFWLTPLRLWSLPRYMFTMTAGYQQSGMVGVVIYSAMITVVVSALYACWRQYPELTIVIAAPAVISAFISVVWQPIFLDRYLLPSASLLIIYLAVNYRGGYLLPVALIIGVAVYLFGESSKPDLRAFYQMCNGADYTYAMDTHLGIMATVYAPTPLITAPDSDSLSQSLSNDAKNALGFDYNEIEAIDGSLCVPFVEHPMTAPHEYERLNIALTRPHTQSVMFQSAISSFVIYRVFDHE